MSVLSQILNAFRATQPEPLPAPDAKLALGALMVQIAMSDKDYQLAEISRIDRVLAQFFDLGPIEAAKMRATCEKLYAAAPETETFAELLRSELPHDARCRALPALWQIVLADGEIQDSEVQIVEDARLALGLSQDDMTAARISATDA